MAEPPKRKRTFEKACMECRSLDHTILQDQGKWPDDALERGKRLILQGHPGAKYTLKNLVECNFKEAIRRGDLGLLQQLHDSGDIPEYPLNNASEYDDRPDIAELILEWGPSDHELYIGFMRMIKHERPKMIELLIPHVGYKTTGGRSFIADASYTAAQEGYLESLKVLRNQRPHIMKFNAGRDFQVACAFGRAEVMKWYKEQGLVNPAALAYHTRYYDVEVNTLLESWGAKLPSK
jgi:hypothetical protein